MTPRLIAFAGYGGAGKDEAAWNLLQQGYVRRNFGDVIKAFYNPFTTRQVTPDVFLKAIHAHRDPRVSAEQVEDFAQRVLLPFYRAGRPVSAHTEDRGIKPLVRPLLEEGGDLIYDWVEARYFHELDQATQRGQRVVNTRLCRVSEARQWRNRGGVVVEVHRAGLDPSTEWDEDVLIALRAGGHLTHRITNASPSGDHWRAVSAPAQLAQVLPQEAHVA